MVGELKKKKKKKKWILLFSNYAFSTVMIIEY